MTEEKEIDWGSHVCPRDDKARPYAAALCSMCMGRTKEEWLEEVKRWKEKKESYQNGLEGHVDAFFAARKALNSHLQMMGPYVDHRQDKWWTVVIRANRYEIESQRDEDLLDVVADRVETVGNLTFLQCYEDVFDELHYYVIVLHKDMYQGNSDTGMDFY